MNIPQSQGRPRLQENEFSFSEEKPDDRVAKLSGTPGSLSTTDLPPSEMRTLDDHEFQKSLDPEKDATEVTDKYAKYAGEAPDGGLKAWSVVLGTGLVCFATTGYVTAWGIFQGYYQEVLLSYESPSTIAWIGSIQYALLFIPALLVGRLFDIGYFRIPYFIGSCLLIVCTFLVAECKEYWQFLLCQGVGIGLGCGILFGPALGIVSHWFKKRRGLALGVNAVGSSFGGIVFPIAAQNLLPEVGFKWTMRIFGFLLLFVLIVANLAVDRRLPPANVKGGLFNWAALKNPAYSLYCLSSITIFLGLFTVVGCDIATNALRTVLTYIPVSAVQVGVSQNFAFYYIGIANGASTFGRIASGILSDRFGPVIVMIPFITLTAIMTFVWPYVGTEGGLVAVCVVYGFSCGTFLSLVVAPVIPMGPMGDVGRRTGLLITFAAIGTLGGPPISGAINSTTGGWEAVGWWSGSILLFSVCLLNLVRYFHLGKLAGRY